MTDANERANDKDEDEDRLRALHNDPQVFADVRGEDAGAMTSPPSPGGRPSAACERRAWLPLESNPEIFTKFARRVAQLPSEWEFVDVLGVDESLLQLVPRPVAAVVMLFPCTDKIYNYRSHQKKELLKLQENQKKEQHQNQNQQQQFCQEYSASKKAIHIEQVASFGNACGTIACLHVLSNLSALSSSSSSNNALDETFQRHNISIPDIGHNGSAVSSVQKTMSSMDNARDRGQMLVQSTEFHESSDEAATSTSAQTECPATGDTHLGHHYVAFVPIPVENTVHIVELDGTTISPIDHGPVESIHNDGVGSKNRRNGQDDSEKQQEQTSQGPEKKKKNQHNQSSDFLHSVMTVCRTKWMDLEPGRIDFSLMALSKTTTTTTTTTATKWKSFQ